MITPILILYNEASKNEILNGYRLHIKTIRKRKVKVHRVRHTLARLSELPVTKTVPLALYAQQNI